MTGSKIDPSGNGPTGGPLVLRRGVLTVTAAVLLALLIVGHRFVPNVYGLGSLVDSAAPVLGAGIPLLALAAVLRRSRLALAMVVIPAAIWAVVFGTAWLPAEGSGPVQFRVASQNLLAGNPDPAATANALVDTKADLVGLQEVADDVHTSVAAVLRDHYPHQVSMSTVELWSRFPIRESVGVDTGLDWTRALRAVVATPTGDVAVYVVHLGSARAGDTSTRDRTVLALAEAVRRDAAERLIVLGDLNTASTDRVIAPLTDLLDDAQVDAGRGLGFTWPAALPVTRPDHVLYRGLTATSAGVVRTPASDHRAVVAGFRR
ncbi:teicoplanin resistance protein VanJ [Micromonospora polyrhachis]|uniref:Vancomycin resistance protein VanJ n=1 Tax=Micromonospora polyrhachis TaxID=1282883 RepID=A0A7W7SXH9_9ACTN|nr:endonuclease/exonuclease/phosphatase family protein [Micromonospora polyrhachis]MBB4962411.1 vancomycin resistance protein VanJ [Micromonospora polyrhachis]